MDTYLAEIILAGFSIQPKGWAFCQAQLLSIQQNQALFSILGTTYGGNGIQTFGLPDLRGRTSINWGQGPGLNNYVLGEQSGATTVTLVQNNLPAHTHSLNATAAAGNAPSPGGNLVGQSPSGAKIYGVGPSTATMAATMVGNAGGNLPVPIMQPYLCLNYLIALSGVFPSRN
jgi:microcystin-dependent protein